MKLHSSRRAVLFSLCLLLVAARAPARSEAPELDDGPYLFLEDSGGVTAHWAHEGKLESRHFEAGEAVRLPRFQHLLGSELKLDPPEPPPAIWEAPKKLLVISDVEGQYRDVFRFLSANGVIDRAGKWSFGDGHLVCVGDFVDRGTEVTEVLWLFHRLTGEATRAGGHVHFLLGNHEAMVLGGDVRYTDEKYKVMAKRLELRCEELLGAKTVLGRWLRSCNSVERIGELIFVHAGLSPAVAGESFDYAAVNSQVRSVLGVPKKEIEDRTAKELVWGRQGPLWYRGYFEKYADDYGPVPELAVLDKILEHAGGSTIVVGHTKVERVTSMFEGRVLAIDIPWTKPEEVRGLWRDEQGLATVDIHGEREAFAR